MHTHSRLCTLLLSPRFLRQNPKSWGAVKPAISRAAHWQDTDALNTNNTVCIICLGQAACQAGGVGCPFPEKHCHGRTVDMRSSPEFDLTLTLKISSLFLEDGVIWLFVHTSLWVLAPKDSWGLALIDVDSALGILCRCKGLAVVDAGNLHCSLCSGR